MINEDLILETLKNTSKHFEHDIINDIKDFDVMQYAFSEEDYDIIDNKSYSFEMRRVRDLIICLIEKGANKEEMLRAIKYSMVVIDSFEKHLDFYKAFKDFKILSLKEKYGLYNKRT